MTPGSRLALALAIVTVTAGGVFAAAERWMRTPEAPTPAASSGDRAARIETLREAIEAQREALTRARKHRSETSAELERLNERLSSVRGELEALEERLGDEEPARVGNDEPPHGVN